MFYDDFCDTLQQKKYTFDTYIEAANLFRSTCCYIRKGNYILYKTKCIDLDVNEKIHRVAVNERVSVDKFVHMLGNEGLTNIKIKKQGKGKREIVHEPR